MIAPTRGESNLENIRALECEDHFKSPANLVRGFFHWKSRRGCGDGNKMVGSLLAVALPGEH